MRKVSIYTPVQRFTNNVGVGLRRSEISCSVLENGPYFDGNIAILSKYGLFAFTEHEISLLYGQTHLKKNKAHRYITTLKK